MLCHFYVDVLNPSFRRWKVSIQKFVNSSRHRGGEKLKFPIGAWFSDISSDWLTVKCDQSFVNQTRPGVDKVKPNAWIKSS